MTILAFCSVAIAFAFAIVSTAMFFGGLEIMDAPSKAVNAPSNASIVFEESIPVSSPVKTARIDFGAYRRNRLQLARINALAVLSDAQDAVDCIQWASARDAESGKYSYNPLAMSHRARFGYDKVYSGEDALMRIQDILSDMDLSTIASW